MNDNLSCLKSNLVFRWPQFEKKFVLQEPGRIELQSWSGLESVSRRRASNQVLYIMKFAHHWFMTNRWSSFLRCLPATKSWSSRWSWVEVERSYATMTNSFGKLYTWSTAETAEAKRMSAFCVYIFTRDRSLKVMNRSILRLAGGFNQWTVHTQIGVKLEQFQ